MMMNVKPNANREDGRQDNITNLFNPIKEYSGDVMASRWRTELEKSLPAIDLIDLSAEHEIYLSYKR